jgi:hypothetical protein
MYARVRRHEVVIGLQQHDLLPQTILALAQRMGSVLDVEMGGD